MFDIDDVDVGIDVGIVGGVVGGIVGGIVGGVEGALGGSGRRGKSCRSESTSLDVMSA